LLWFVLISPSGWFQHVWVAVCLAFIFFFIVIGRLTDQLPRRALAIVLAGVALLGYALTFDSIKLNGSFLLSHGDLISWNSDDFRYSRARGSLQNIKQGKNMGEVRNPFFEKHYQEETISFLKENLGPNDLIFVMRGIANPEISMMIDKIFYPLDNYFFLLYLNKNRVQYSPAEEDRFHFIKTFLSYPRASALLMLGPYVHCIHPWKLGTIANGTSYQIAQQHCSKIVFSNDYYLICLLKNA
jgi:hypothetical protein